MLRLHFGCLQDTVIEEDKEFVTQYFDMPDTDFADMERMSPWLLRIELNREMLTDKGLNMSRIADTITSEFGEEMSVIFTDDNAPKHILRVSPIRSQHSAASSTVLLVLWQAGTCSWCLHWCCLSYLYSTSTSWKPSNLELFEPGLSVCGVKPVRWQFLRGGTHPACQGSQLSGSWLNLQIRMLGEEGGKDASGVHEHGDDVFLKKIESHLLTQASASTSEPCVMTLFDELARQLWHF